MSEGLVFQTVWDEMKVKEKMKEKTNRPMGDKHFHHW